MFIRKGVKKIYGLKVFIKKENEIIRFGNKIVVFKIIVTNEIIRLGNEIICFGIVFIIIQGKNHTKN